MASKLIQLKDGNDSLYPCLPVTTGQIEFTSTTSLSQSGIISMPNGLKLLRVYINYNTAAPLKMVLSENGVYEQSGNIDANGEMVCQFLSLTTLTNATNEYVFTKYASVGNSTIYYQYVLLST